MGCIKLMMLGIMAWYSNLLMEQEGAAGTLASFFPIPAESTEREGLILSANEFYGLKEVFLIGIGYQSSMARLYLEYLNATQFFKQLSLFISGRWRGDGGSIGAAVGFERILNSPVSNNLEFSFSVGKCLNTLEIYASLYGIPQRLRILFLAVYLLKGIGKGSIYLEGERYLELKTIVYQEFKVNSKIVPFIYIGFGPYKAGFGLSFSHLHYSFRTFIDLHNRLGSSLGVIVEYAFNRMYNLKAEKGG